MTSKMVLALLNSYGTEFLKGNLIERYYPLDFHDCSFTSFSSEDMAFTLNRVDSGIVNVEMGKDSKLGAVTRQCVGYAVATRLAEDERRFYYHMSLLVNNALTTLTKNIGNLQGRQAFAERAGEIKDYFREMDSMAGYEFRIYVPDLK